MSAKPRPSTIHTLGSGLGQPASYRDASNPRSGLTSNGKAPWKKEPTAIAEPSNRLLHTPRQLGHNPFNIGSLKDTLHPTRGAQKKPTTGNNTTRKTVLSRPKEQPVTSRHFPVGGTSSAIHENRLRSSQSSPDLRSPINVDEDIDHRASRSPSPHLSSRIRRSASPDPIDILRAGSSDFSTHRKTSSPFKPLTQRPQWNTAVDGPSTQRLGQRVNGKQPKSGRDHQELEIIQIIDDEVESITSFSDDGPKSKPPTRANPPSAGPRVRDMVNIIESRTTPASSSIQRIDLKEKRGISKNMKPRIPALQREPIDQEMTAPSGFVTETKSVRKPRFAKPDPDIVLPLAAFALGLKVHDGETSDTPYWMHFDGSKLTIRHSQEATEDPLLEIDTISNFVGGVDATTSLHSYLKDVILVLKTVGSARPYPHYNSKTFKHRGKGDNGHIILKFYTQHPDWSDGKPYQALVERLKKLELVRDRIDSHASKGVWQRAIHASEMAVQLQGSLSSSEDESSSFKRHKPDEAADEPENDVNLSKPAKPNSGSNSRSTVRPRPITRPSSTSVTIVPRRTTRSTLAASARASPVPDPDEIILVYPPSGTGAVNITRGDLKRLDPGQYLNDTLIEFALKLWLNELRETDPELADQIHIFSSFFYKKIQVKNKQEGYNSVRKWTSKFDLFKKKYIIVPINEHLHWYLAIICNPEFTLQPPPPQPEKVVSAVQTRKRKRGSDLVEQQTSVASPEPPPPQDPPTDSPAATAEDENSVEAMLTTCSLNQDASSDSVASPGDLNAAQDTSELSLQYPSDEISEVPPPDTSTEAAEDSRHASEPIDIDAEPSASHEDEVPMDVDEVIEDPAEASDAIPCTSFYASGSSKGKQPAVMLSPEVPYLDPTATSVAVDVPNMDLDDEGEDLPVPEPTDFRRDKTYIFTFDSLGTKHPAAARNLSHYLQLEAKDKKSLDETTPPSAATALVPAQPNFCDCGVYLIHFVQTFMDRPDKFSETIVTKKAKDYDSKERESDWDADAVGSLRETLLAKIMSLSDEWKKEKAVREEQKRKEVAEGTGAPAPDGEVIPDSDDEIIVGEVVSKTSAKKGAGKGKQTSKNDKAARSGEESVLRLR